MKVSRILKHFLFIRKFMFSACNLDLFMSKLQIVWGIAMQQKQWSIYSIVLSNLNNISSSNSALITSTVSINIFAITWPLIPSFAF